MQTNEQLEEILIKSLTNVLKKYQELGTRGIENRQNTFGKFCLEADWEGEEIVIETFKEHQVPITIVSEEHGVVELGNEFLGVLDGLDGSNAYKDLVKGVVSEARFGAMVGIFRGIEPRYGDYITSGIMEHSTQRLFVASKGKGCYLFTNGNRKQLDQPQKVTVMDMKTKIRLTDSRGYEWWPVIDNTFIKKLQGCDVGYYRSFVASFIDLITGRSHLLTECTRKRNLETAAGYPMLKELGGTIVTLDGHDIGTKQYREFGYNENEYIPFVATLTPELAGSFLRYIKHHSN